VPLQEGGEGAAHSTGQGGSSTGTCIDARADSVEGGFVLERGMFALERGGLGARGRELVRPTARGRAVAVQAPVVGKRRSN